MDSQDSSDHPNRSENRYHSSSGDANLPEKRKREPEPNPETSPDPPVPPPPQHPLWKTSLCSYFHKTGGLCSHGETCRFAHGEDELRVRPDNTWDPTSERAKKMAKIEENEQEEAQERGVMMTEALEAEECSSSLSKCIVNLPMKWSSDNLRNFLNEQGIIYKSAKKKKGMTVGFVTFGSSEGVKNGQKELAGRSVGNNKTLKVVDVIPRSFEKNNRAALPLISNEKIEKSSADSDQTNLTESTNTREVDEDGTSFLDGSVLKARSARDAVTPLAHLPYSDQLEHKKKLSDANSKKTDSQCAQGLSAWCFTPGMDFKISRNWFCSDFVFRLLDIVYCFASLDFLQFAF